MGQERSQFGVPRAGSAARLAEESGGNVLAPRRISLGSAARDAENRKKSEDAEETSGPLMRSHPVAALRPAVSLRGQGGRVVTREEMIEASRVGTRNNQGGHAAPAGSTAVPAGVSATASPVPIAASFHLPLPAVASGAQAHPLAEAELPLLPGPPRFSADRVKALVRSLFSRNG